jgi:AraC-like DNA-binding protein
MEQRSDVAGSIRREDSQSIRTRIGSAILAALAGKEELETSIPGLTLAQRSHPVPPTSYLYSPSFAMIVQGRKNIVLGNSAYHYDETQFLLTAVNLPTITEVVQASPERPYISIMLKLDLAAAKQIITDMDLEDAPAPAGSAMAVGPSTPQLFDALARLIDLLASPADIPILGDLIQRELLYRVLTGPTGSRLRQIVRIGTQSNRVARAVTWLRENYQAPLRVEALAELTNMGLSTLHHHFRMMTSMSPLQFQKHLRLHEARRLLLSEEMDAGSAALAVGYESATQFSREYRRLFGAPPLRDVKSLRLTHTVGLVQQNDTL